MKSRPGKAVVKLAVFALIAAFGVASLAVIAAVWQGTTRSSETDAIFNAAAELPPELVGAVTWLPDPADLPRTMEPLTRQDITAAWLRAWEQLAIVPQSGDTSGLAVYFDDSALAAARATAGAGAGLAVHQIGHELQLDFYSADGQVVGVRSLPTRLVRSVPLGTGVGLLDTEESYEAVLVLQDGNWRIQHLVRTAYAGHWWTDAPPRSTTAPRAMNGVNYFPREHPFSDFWPNYDHDTVAADLDRVRDLGFDTIRIFLPFDQLGGRSPSDHDLAPVLDLLDTAESRGLGVVATLFDGRTDHRPLRWDADDDHLRKVVATLMGHPALRMWDLKNEPDRDIGINGSTRADVEAWLSHIAWTVRGIDPATPTTIGWSTAAAAAAAPVVVDVVSFHHYTSTSDLTGELHNVAARAAQRPVMVSEFGLPTWQSRFFPLGHDEAEQAATVADVLSAARAAHVLGTFVWTLWDLASAPPDAGQRPWQVGSQTSFGVLRADGTAKPAASLFAPGADLAAVPRPGQLHRLRSPFATTVLVVAVAGSGFVVGWRRIRRRRRTRRALDRLASLPGES